MSERGLSDSDHDRIADYLSRPANERQVDDLIPGGHEDETDAAEAIETGDVSDATDGTDAADAADDDAN